MPPARNTTATIWFEVEDGFGLWGRHLHGIPRVCAEIYRAALDENLPNIRFCRISEYGGAIQIVAPETIRAVFGLTSRPPSRHRRIQEYASDLKVFVRQTAQHISDLTMGRMRQAAFERAVKPGDILLAIGATWNTGKYEQRLAAAKSRYGLKVAALIHDIIPLMNDDPAKHDPRFRRWFDTMLRTADCLFTPSRFTKLQIEKDIQRRAVSSPPPLHVVRFGSGFGFREDYSGDPGSPLCPEPFVLMVGTISAPHKNHRLLVSVWQRLLEKYGSERVPTLAFAGHRFGRDGDTLFADLEQTKFLNGKIVWFSNLGDADLQRLYRRCLFTSFPSFVEGWGLPVDESLAAGKFCVASNRASLPEIGGDLLDYVDPKNADQAFETIERAVMDGAYLAARTQAIRENYAIRSWSDCLHAMLATAKNIPARQDGTA